MKKTYIIPAEKVAKITPIKMLAESDPKGVQTNCSLGNEFTSTDESYVKDGNLWDDEW